MIFALLLLPSVVFAFNPTCFLQHYGYLDGNAQTTDITHAVKRFQEVYGLPGGGNLNSETLEFMQKQRCGNKDDLLPFSAHPNNKWRHNIIKWYMFGNGQHEHLVERAFNLWAKYANLTFIRDIRSPHIILSFSDKKHMDYARQNSCFYDFDGPGTVLAHAFIPELHFNQTDIHFDNEENWDFTMNPPGSGNTSFYTVAVHEIGHALGLHHSYVQDTIMYPFYRVPTGIADLYEYDLSDDDIKGIRVLYGHRVMPTVTTIPTTTSTPTTSTSTTTTEATKVEPLTYFDICRVRHDINTFFVLKNRLYAFYRDYIWHISLDKNRRTREEYTQPKLIRDFLPFLPAFYNISVYERPNGEIVMFVDKAIYYIQYPSLKRIRSKTLDSLLGRRTDYINAAVSDNNGRAYILSQDWLVYEVDECTENVENLGYISDVFKGVPKGVMGALKYTNGRLYFKLKSTIVEYDQYTETVTRSFDDIINVLDLFCPREELTQKLYEILRDVN